MSVTNPSGSNVPNSDASNSDASNKPHAYRLVSLNADPALRTPSFDLTQGTSFAGRLKSCELQLPGSLVSRRHAKFQVTEECVTIHDLDSHNGIFLNGTKIRSSAISPGDKLYFANICFAVEELPFVKEHFLNANTHENMIDDSLDAGTAERGLAALVRTTDLMSIDDDEIFFNEVMRLITEMSGAQFSALMRMLPNEGLKEIVVAKSSSQLENKAVVHRPVVEAAMGNRTPIWSRAQKLPENLLSGLPPILCLPIVAVPRVLGAIYVQRRSPIPFSQADVDTIMAVSQMLAIRMTGNVGGGAIDEATQVREGITKTEEAEKNASQIQELHEEVRALLDEIKLEQRKAEGLEDQLRGAASIGAKLKKVEDELDVLKAQKSENEAELKELKAELLKAQKDLLEAHAQGEHNSSLENALFEALPPRLMAHLKSRIESSSAEPTRDLATTCALSIQMAGFDAWSGTAPLDEVEKKLDLFCRTVRTLSTANDGAVEQIFGHTHLVLFHGDADGVKKALVCAQEILATLPAEGTVGLQAAVHLGSNLSGFFGDGLQAAYLQAGEAVAVARGALESPVAQAGSILVTEGVRTLLAGDPTYTLVTLGPSFIKGFQTPFSLYQLVGTT